MLGNDRDAHEATRATFADVDGDVVAESRDKLHQPLNGEAIDVIVGKRRDFRLIDVQELCQLCLLEFKRVESLSDEPTETCFRELFFRVW